MRIRRLVWSAAIIFTAVFGVSVLCARLLDNVLLGSLLIAVVSAVLLLILGVLAKADIDARAIRIRRYAEGLVAESLPDVELPEGEDQLGKLAQSLRRTAPQIRDLIDKLRIEGARRETILSSMVEGVLAIDKDSRVTFCNASFARIVGARLPVSAGMPLTHLVRDPALLDILRRVLSTGERVERRLSLPAQAHSFEVLAGPLEGPSIGVLAILHDITLLEQLERIRKDFVANVSHELRTPLASIRGYAETLLDGALGDRENNRRFVEIILSHAIRLNDIASDLLIISELESGRDAAAPPARVSIRAGIEAALRTVEASARMRGIRIVTGPMENVYVIGHQLRLEQALLNLLDNAIKFNRPDGEVRIEMRSAGEKAEVVISDTGIGIPSEDLPRIFERFYRVDKARSRAVGGTGLGLSIVRHVVEQMGGTIAVESRLGRGSRFTLTVPIAK